MEVAPIAERPAVAGTATLFVSLELSRSSWVVALRWWRCTRPSPTR